MTCEQALVWWMTMRCFLFLFRQFDSTMTRASMLDMQHVRGRHFFFFTGTSGGLWVIVDALRQITVLSSLNIRTILA